MCTKSCLDFVKNTLGREEIEGRSVIEVGARDVNGSPRSYIEGLRPSKYVGVDIMAGPGVDEICDAGDLQTRFGPQSFDVVICTEMMEHVIDWRRMISNLKAVLGSGGILVLTTRSRGFGYHDYPHDVWRFEPNDLRNIFSDFHVDEIGQDTESPGAFIKATKPDGFVEVDLSDYKLYSIMILRRAKRVTKVQARIFAFALGVFRRTVPRSFRTAVKRIVSRRS